jgi:hypothetical protein
MEDEFCRRSVLAPTAAFGLFAALGAAGCGKDEGAALSCTDTSGLDPDAVALRTGPAVAYADRSIDPVKSCARCQQFLLAASANACGTCKVIKGPVHPRGSCKLFVPRMA